MLIYVAGPLSSHTREGVKRNISRAKRAGYEVLRKGHYPFIPHLNVNFLEQFTGEGNGLDDGTHWDSYLEWDFAFLLRCDAILYLAKSPGADRELALAKAAGLLVYKSVEEIPDATATSRQADVFRGSERDYQRGEEQTVRRSYRQSQACQEALERLPV